MLCKVASLSRARRAATPKVVVFVSSLYRWLSAGCEWACGSRRLRKGDKGGRRKMDGWKARHIHACDM